MEIKTFADFIKEYNIEIPIIQRDYVYGREKARETGADLVKAMIDSIKNCKVLDLNFIYGMETGSEDGKKRCYFPIDGQQRLTTIFLLYWYISIKSGNKTKFFDLHPNFSYKTRSSANEFFMWISDSNNEKLFELVSDSNRNIDEGIKDMSGFKASWNYDNTVQSCIYILNQIAETLKNDTNDKIEDYYNNMNAPDKCPLKFTVISENNTAVENKDGMDEAKAKANKTYIRMNARGKQLTAFEKIKSIVDSLEKEDKADDDKFSYKYDTKYINDMYDNAKNSTTCSSSVNRLEYITFQIDRMSHVFFMNMFMVLRVSEGESYEVCINEVDSDSYVKKLKGLYNDKAAAHKYIDFMNYYMEFLMKNKKFDSKAFKNRGMGDKFLSIYAEVLYVYYFATMHKQNIPTESDIEIFHLVLKNLQYSKWSDRYRTIDEFIKELTVKDNLIQYFCNVNQCNASVQKCGLDDINTRWKEQVLLAKYCTYVLNNHAKTQDSTEKYSDLDVYRKIEKYRGMGCDKLQFVMYMADIWDKSSPNPSEFEFFNSCLEQYSRYREDESGLLWRQNYAIAAYTEIENGTVGLKDNDFINSISMGEKHIWNDCLYMWNDEEEKKKTYCSTLCIAKQAYSLGLTKLTELKNSLILEDSSTPNMKYAETWLGYALIWSDKLKECIQNNTKKYVCTELFRCRLTNEKKSLGSVLFERSANDKKPFMMHIFKISHLQNSQSEFYYGFKNFSREILDKMYPVHLEYSPYNGYIDHDSNFYNFRTCNIAIKVHETIEKHFFKDLPSEEDLCLYQCEEENGRYYIIYEYQENTPNTFKRYKYDMSGFKADCSMQILNWKQFELTVEDQLIAYKACGGWSSEAINMQQLNMSNTCVLWSQYKDAFNRKNSSYTYTIKYEADILQECSADDFVTI